MKTKPFVTIIFIGVFTGFLLVCASQQAGAMEKTGKSPQIYGTLGSPSATTTIDGKQLPPMPDEKFGGKIERNAIDSTPYWPPRVVPPKVLGTPNPESSVMMSSTLGACLGGTMRGAHHGFELRASFLITPPNFGSGAGSCLPLMVVVALGEPGTPVIC